MNTIIFDMDGVIFDSEAVCLEAWQRIAKRLDLKGIKEAFLRCTGTTMVETRRIMLETYGDTIDYDSLSKEVSDYFYEYETTHGHLPIKPGAKEILSYLKENGYKVGLASSTLTDIVTRQLKGAGLYDYFDVVVGGDMIKKSKPEPDIYLAACEKIGAAPENAYAVEDSYNGIRSAYSAGMKPIMVPDLLKPNDEMREKCFMIKDDLFELMKVL